MTTTYTPAETHALGYEAGAVADTLPDAERIGIRAEITKQRDMLRGLNLDTPWHNGFLSALNGALPCGCIGCCEGEHIR